MEQEREGIYIYKWIMVLICEPCSSFSDEYGQRAFKGW